MDIFELEKHVLFSYFVLIYIKPWPVENYFGVMKEQWRNSMTGVSRICRPENFENRTPLIANGRDVRMLMFYLDALMRSSRAASKCLDFTALTGLQTLWVLSWWAPRAVQTHCSFSPQGTSSRLQTFLYPQFTAIWTWCKIHTNKCVKSTIY